MSVTITALVTVQPMNQAAFLTVRTATPDQDEQGDKLVGTALQAFKGAQNGITTPQAAKNAFLDLAPHNGKEVTRTGIASGGAFLYD